MADASQDSSLATASSAAGEYSSRRRRKRSALGVGVTTLVTVIVVLLLTAFAVLSLVSARSNLRLSEMAIEQTQNYYAADYEALSWYAELDAFAAALDGEPSEFADQLRSAGYEVEIVTQSSTGDENASEVTGSDQGSTDTRGELRVANRFTIQENQSLMVTVTVNDDRTTTIRQWQS